MRLLSYFLMILLVASCQRDPPTPNNPPPPEPPPVPNNPPPPKKLDGVVYSVGRWRITAFDIAQEKTIWQSEVLPTLLDANTTIYNDGTIYTHSGNGVIAFDATNGNIKWKQNKSVGITVDGGMPVIEDTLIYTIAGNPFIGPAPSLFCLNAKTGIIIWQKPLQVNYSSQQALGSPVVIGDKVIGVGHGGASGAPKNSIYCFNRFDGSLIWYDGTTVSNEIRPFPFTPDSSQIIFPAGFAGVATDGLYAFDVNTGSFLWHNSAFVISPRLVNIYKNNRVNLIGHKGTAIFDLSSKTAGNLVIDTIYRATTSGDRIFLTKYDFNSPIKCRKIFNKETIWEIANPYKQVWDTTTGISNSYTSSLVTDDDYLYYHEYIFNGPNPSTVNSLFIYNKSEGTLTKEIKLKDSEHPLNRTFFIVRNGKAYYTDMK